MGDYPGNCSWDHLKFNGDCVKKFFQTSSAVLAILAGMIVLVGYFLPIDLPWLRSIREMIFQWVIILTAVAVLVGIANLFSVHSNKVIARKPGFGFSLVLVVSLVITLVVAGYFGPTAPATTWIYQSIQVPVELSLMALLVVILVFSGARLIIRRPNIYSLLFIFTAIVVLFGVAAWPLLPINLHQFRSWILQVPVAAGTRGLLLGVALGSVAAGMRIILGSDRPYQG